MFGGKRVLITGGTGSVGQRLAEILLQHDPKSVRIFSRNEQNQIAMSRRFAGDGRLRFLIGDVRDYPRLLRAMEDVDVVFHAASLRDVIMHEYNPFETIKTNVLGTQNLIDACHAANVELAVGISTDRAVSPVSVYGGTKLLMEKIFLTAKNYLNVEKHLTKFAVVRQGAVLGGRESTVPGLVRQIRSKQTIRIADPEMTGFCTTLDCALDFVISSAKMAKIPATFVPKLGAYGIMDLMEALFELVGKTEYEVDGNGSGEMLSEVLINPDEMRVTLEGGNGFIIGQEDTFDRLAGMYPDHKRASVSSYSSDSVKRLSKGELVGMLAPVVKDAGTDL